MLLPHLLEDNLPLLLHKPVQNRRIFQIITSKLNIGHLELGLGEVVRVNGALACALLLQNGFAVIPEVHSHRILVTIEKLIWRQIFQHNREIGHLNRVTFKFFDELCLLFFESIVKHNIQNNHKNVDADDEDGELVLGDRALVAVLVGRHAHVHFVSPALGNKNNGLRF